MLSSFFNKSKPINFIVIALYMFVLYTIAYFKRDPKLDYEMMIRFIGGFIISVFAMFVVNGITQKNDLTQKSTNTVLLYGFLTSIVSYALINSTILVANAFIILAMRSVLDLKEGKDIKSHILNASMYIGVASLAYFWSIVFVVIVYLGVLFFGSKNYRNWLIPIIGILIIYLLSNCFTLLFYDSFFRITDYIKPVSFSFDRYIDGSRIYSTGVLILCILFFFSLYIVKFSRKPAKSKPILKIIVAQLLVAIIVVFIVPDKNTTEMIFIASPLAIIGTTYLEMDHNIFVREINLWVFLILPFITILF